MDYFLVVILQTVTVDNMEHIVESVIIPRDQILGMRKKTFIAGTGMSHSSVVITLNHRVAAISLDSVVSVSDIHSIFSHNWT